MKVFFSLILFAFNLFAPTAREREIVIDGSLSDWHPDELIYEDPLNDSAWGTQNELGKLYLTWDELALYIGISGAQKDGNNLIVYIDTHPFYLAGVFQGVEYTRGDILNWWWGRNHKFPRIFLPDFQWSLWQMKLWEWDFGSSAFTLGGKGLYQFTAPNDVPKDVNYKGGKLVVLQKSSGDDVEGMRVDTTGKYCEAEVRIPWDIIYPVFPKGAVLKIAVALTGGADERDIINIINDGVDTSKDDWVVKYKEYKEGGWWSTGTVILTKYERERNLAVIDWDRWKYCRYGSAHDTIPNQSKPFTYEWCGLFEFDSWIEVKIDSDEDGLPDFEISPISRNLDYEWLDGGRLRCFWKRREVTERDLDKYVVEISSCQDFRHVIQYTTTENSLTINGLLPLTAYYLRIHAVYRTTNVKSGYSNVLTIKPLGGLFSNRTPSNHPYYDKPVTFILDLEAKNAMIEFSSITYVHPGTSKSEAIKFYEVSDGVWRSTHNVKLTSVPRYLDYYFSVKLKNFEVVSLPFDAPGEKYRMTFKPKIEKVVKPSETSVIMLDELTKLIIHPYSVSTEKLVSIEYAPISDIYQVLEPDFTPLAFYKVSSNEPYLAFKKEAEIFLKYFIPEDERVDEDNISIYHWTGNNWVRLSTKIDKNKKVVEAKINSTGGYAVIYSPRATWIAEAKLKEVKNATFFPQRGEVVGFYVESSNPQKVELSVFDLTGLLIYKEEKVSDFLSWDGMDMNKRIVEPGLYIYRLKLPDKVISGLCVLAR